MILALRENALYVGGNENNKVEMLSPDPCAVPCGGTVIRPVSYCGFQLPILCASVESVTDICMPLRLMLSRAIRFRDMKANIQNRKFPVETQQRDKWCGDL